MSITDVTIYSHRMGELFRVNRFKEYYVDIDLETDSDQFNMVLSNPGGVYTGIFNKFDPIAININNEGIFYGTLDEVEGIGDDAGNIIRIMGRDLAGILIDNDALPVTKLNVKPDKYIAEKCNEYGISKHNLDTTIPIMKKLIIGTGETEISVMGNLIVEHNRRLWMQYDTLHMGKWNTGANPTWRFTRGLDPSTDDIGIPIKSISIKDSGIDLRSEYRIYGSANDGKEKMIGVAKNDYLNSIGVRKRKIIRSYNNDASSKYSSNAYEKIRDDFRNGLEIKVTVATNDHAILPNTTAHVIDVDNKLNAVLFIKGVNYNKSISGGSVTEVTMIPGDTTFEVYWKNVNSVTGTNKTTKQELLQRK